MYFRNLVLSLFCVGSCTGVMAQKDEQSSRITPYTPELCPPDAPVWLKELGKKTEDINFWEAEKLFKKWCAEDVDVRVKTSEKKPAVNFFRRWQKAYRNFVGEDGKIVLPTSEAYLDSLQAQNKRRTLALELSSDAKRWRNIGPNTTRGWSWEQRKVVGKDAQACVYRIAVAKTNPNTVYCGTETGVVFKTTNKGDNWLPCNAVHNFGGPIFALAVSPYDENIVLVGGGQNLWKSVDGGNTWKPLQGVEKRVNSIRFGDNSNEITVSTGAWDVKGGGFYYSTNGGETFQRSFIGACYDHELQPQNSKQIYLLGKKDNEWGFRFYVSKDGGKNFSLKGLNNLDDPDGLYKVVAGRLAVSEAPGGENYLYALLTTADDLRYGPYGGRGKPFILQSKDAGETWVDQTDRDEYRGTFSPIHDSFGGQGYFDMIVGSSAQDPEHVIFGFCSSYRSTKGGKGGMRETAIGGYQNLTNMHPDMQDIVVCGNDTWITTDGGVKYSNDFFATPGQDKNTGIYAAEYHGFGQGWNEDVMAGGRWHNGDAILFNPHYGEGNSLHVGGVEYATGHVLLSNSRKIYFSDSGTNTITTNINDQIQTTYDQFRDKKPYETIQTTNELGFDPRYALRLLMSSNEKDEESKLYLSEDEGHSFTEIYDLDGERVSSYAFSRSNPNHLYVAGTYNIFHSTDNGRTWTQFPTRPYQDEQNGSVAIGIAVDPHDEEKVWYVNPNYSGRLAYTTDLGKTWHYPLTEEMKNKRFNWVILTGSNDGVYVGTQGESFVYYKDNKTQTWEDYSVGLPGAASIARLVPFYKEGKLRAATWQGIWEIPLKEEQFVPVAQPMALNIGNGNITHTPNKEIQFDSYSIVNQKNATWEWSFSPQPQSVVGANTRNPRVVFGKPGKYAVTLKVTTPEGSHARTIPDMVVIDFPTSLTKVQSVEAKVNVQKEGNQTNLLVETAQLPYVKVLTIHNLKGKLLTQETLNAEEQNKLIDITHLPAGAYVYELKTAHHKFFGKFIKE